MLKAKNRKFSNRIPLGHRYLFYIPLLSSTGSSTYGYRKLVRRPSTRQIQGMYLKCCVEITQFKGVCKLKQSLPLSNKHCISAICSPLRSFWVRSRAHRFEKEVLQKICTHRDDDVKFFEYNKKRLIP